MELEAPQEIYSDVRALGAQIVVITPELERHSRALHKKLNLSFDILTDFPSSSSSPGKNTFWPFSTARKK